MIGMIINVKQEDIDKAIKMKEERGYRPSKHCAMSMALSRLFPYYKVSSAFGNCNIDEEEYALTIKGDNSIAVDWMSKFDSSLDVKPICFILKEKE